MAPVSTVFFFGFVPSPTVPPPAPLFPDPSPCLCHEGPNHPFRPSFHIVSPHCRRMDEKNTRPARFAF
jgi:hypothetical protein